MSNNFLKLMNQNQVDIVLMEAYPACYHIKRKYGEEVLVDFMKAFGGVSIEIPSAEELRELCKAYFDQEHFKKLEKKNSLKYAISTLNSNNTIKSPTEVKENIKKLSHHFTTDKTSFFDLFYEVVEQGSLDGKE